MRTRRRLALSVLLAAAALAAAMFPFRSTWWGGWLLAIGEAGVVGGLADWFAVTALFRRPLGLPIPHTALIPANWQALAARVGTMVGDRVLTREYLGEELARIDLAGIAARAAGRITRAELETAVRALGEWALREVSPAGAGELLRRAQRLALERPVTPILAAALELACQHGWHQRAIGAVARALAEGLDRPELRRSVEALVDELLARYRAEAGVYPRLMLGVADLLGLIDRQRIVTAVHAGLRAAAADPQHPLRAQLGASIADLARRLRTDPVLGARVEALKEELAASPLARRLVEDATTALREALHADLARPRSEVVGWAVDRLERARQAFVADADRRRDVDRWVKARARELLERHHGRLAALIEQGVRALGPEGAVRLIEEHAGDDLQYIRVNGTLVGGLAGGALYALGLLLQRF